MYTFPSSASENGMDTCVATVAGGSAVVMTMTTMKKMKKKKKKKEKVSCTVYMYVSREGRGR